LGMRCSICNQAARHAETVARLHVVGDTINHTLDLDGAK
jgi:hypothetical protein